MSEIVASNVETSTNETAQVIEDLQNVGTVDKAAKLSAILDKDNLDKDKEVGASSPAPEEVTNGHVDKQVGHQNGTSHNGDAAAEQAVDDHGCSPRVRKISANETSVETTGTGSDDVQPEESSSSETSNTDPKSETKEATEQSNTETPCTAAESTKKSPFKTESEVQSNTESKKSPMKEVSPEKKTEGDHASMSKQMEDLNVETECSKASPAKKSCSPF